MEQPEAHLPTPPSERGAWITAIALCVLGVGVLALVLSGAVGRVASHSSAAVPPPVLAVTPTPVPAATPPVNDVAAAGTRAQAREKGVTGSRSSRAGGGARAILGSHSATEQHRDLTLYEDQTGTHISERWMRGFYPIYAVAQKTFGVNWLLIASIHKQESAFSTAATTYKGLNFAGCCGGPMQFNVNNGPVTTWALVSNSYTYGARPASYDHMTAKHPSIYDDYDAIMAAAHLLSSDGAGDALDGTAWNAAYDYYGHDLTGVTYADQVLARAIGWSQHGFCINCGLETGLVEAVGAAYGTPVAATYEIATVASAKRSKRHKR